MPDHLLDSQKSWRDAVNQTLGRLEQSQLNQGDDIKAIRHSIEGNGQKGIAQRLRELENKENRQVGAFYVISIFVSAAVSFIANLFGRHN